MAAAPAPSFGFGTRMEVLVGRCQKIQQNFYLTWLASLNSWSNVGGRDDDYFQIKIKLKLSFKNSKFCFDKMDK